MIRVFAAITPSEAMRDDLEELTLGLRAGRIVDWENLHLTLRFFGELPEPEVEELHEALARIRAGRVSIAIEGLGVFGGARPRAAYARVTADPALARLRAAVEGAARGAGVALTAERFTPHVTLARFRAGRIAGERAALADWLAPRAGFTRAAETADAFTLFSSRLTREGPIYEPLARYSLVADQVLAGSASASAS